MTDLREKVAKEVFDGWTGEPWTTLDDEFMRQCAYRHADRIVEIMKQMQPKLEWEQCPSCSKLEQLVFSGRMVVAYAQENGFWCSVRPFIELSGIENTAEEARAAVEQAVKEAIRWPSDD